MVNVIVTEDSKIIRLALKNSLPAVFGDQANITYYDQALSTGVDEVTVVDKVKELLNSGEPLVIITDMNMVPGKELDGEGNGIWFLDQLVAEGILGRENLIVVVYSSERDLNEIIQRYSEYPNVTSSDEKLTGSLKEKLKDIGYPGVVSKDAQSKSAGGAAAATSSAAVTASTTPNP